MLRKVLLIFFCLMLEVARANNLYRTELEWMRRMPQARGHKARYREEAFYELEKVAKQRLEERQLRLKASNVYIGSKIFECQYISKAFGQMRNDKGEMRNEPVVILKDFYYNFSRFEKMGITSLVQARALGEIEKDSTTSDRAR